MTTDIDWLNVWRWLQEAGAAIKPVLDRGNVPDWVTQMDEAIDDGIAYAEARLDEDADNAE